MHIPLNVFWLFKDMTIYIAIAMSVMEGILIMSKVAVMIKNYWIIYMRTTMKLNGNLMEMSIRSPSTIAIFALTATWR